MGNILSEEEDEERFLEEGFNLEAPGADKALNVGTEAPIWQNTDDVGQEVIMDGNETNAADRTASQNGAKKLSYIQMAKLGYQELVNAIIRPPRADYKVRRRDDAPCCCSVRLILLANIHVLIGTCRWSLWVLLRSIFAARGSPGPILRCERNDGTTWNARTGNRSSE
jgi:hypothetical protein